MSCEHCTHCQNIERRRGQETFLHPRGTVLIHPKFGRVTYWRPAAEIGPQMHVVLAQDDEDESLYVTAANLTLA